MGLDLKARVAKQADNIRVLNPAAFGTPLAVPADEPSQALVEKTLIEHLRDNRDMLVKAAPAGFDVDPLLKDVEVALLGDDKLRLCDHLSFLGAVMSAVQLGLRVGDLFGHAWLEAIWQRRYGHTEDGKWFGKFRARLIIGYQGMIELAERHPKILSVFGMDVGARDEFEVAYGLPTDTLRHKPHLAPDELRGDRVAYYAIVRYANGAAKFRVLSRAEAEEHRDEHATNRRKNTKTGKVEIVGAWDTHFDDMAVKTCVRLLWRFLPKSTELAAALAVDGAIRVDLSPDGIHHADRPEALNSNVPGPDHEDGHGEGLAWSPECEDCVDDADGERHFIEHSKPSAGCPHCEQEAAWRGLPIGSRS